MNGKAIGAPSPAPRAPGFPQPEPTASDVRSDARSLGEPPALDRRAGTRQLNVRVLVPLLDRHKRLIRELDDAGFSTSLTEVVHALLHDVPPDALALRDLVRS